jgi:hypothetical protein
MKYPLVFWKDPLTWALVIPMTALVLVTIVQCL